MTCITVSEEESFRERMAMFPWVNWSEVGREELLKRVIFEKYIKTGKLSNKEEEFCEKIDWHPVDELELKEEYVKKLEDAKKKPLGKSRTIEEFNKWCDEL